MANAIGGVDPLQVAEHDHLADATVGTPQQGAVDDDAGAEAVPGQ